MRYKHFHNVGIRTTSSHIKQCVFMKIHFCDCNLDLLQQLVANSNRFIFVFRIAIVETVHWKFDISLSGTETRKRFGERLHPSQCTFIFRNCSTHGIRFKLSCFCSGLLGCTSLKSLNLLCHFTGDRFTENLCRNIACSNMFHTAAFVNAMLETLIPCFFQHYRILVPIVIVNIK